jgi:hypothetical protein
MNMYNVDSQLAKRVKSFIWRAGMMGIAAVVAFSLDNIQLLELSPLATTLLGLVLGEISKHLNTKSV